MIRKKPAAKRKPKQEHKQESSPPFLPGDEVEYIGPDISANGLPYSATLTTGTRVTIIQPSVSVPDSYFVKPHSQGFPNTVIHKDELVKINDDII